MNKQEKWSAAKGLKLSASTRGEALADTATVRSITMQIRGRAVGAVAVLGVGSEADDTSPTVCQDLSAKGSRLEFNTFASLQDLHQQVFWPFKANSHVLSLGIVIAQVTV